MPFGVDIRGPSMTSPTNSRCTTRRLLAALSLAAAALPAAAGFTPSGGGDTGGLPLYRALVFGGIDTLAASSPGYLSQDILDGVDYTSNVAALPVASGGGTRSASGATITGNGWTANSGFMASRNHASINVSNAQTTDDYYLVAGQGGTTRVHFNAQTSAAAATFTWHVSGTASTSGIGRADSRLDFAATTSPGTDWSQILFGAGETAMTEYGTGTFSHTVPVTGQAQDVFLYWWTSAFTLLTHDTSPQGSNASLTADFGSTYVLAEVQLFDDLGNQLSDWVMTDLDTQQAVFDATGRLAAVIDAPTIPDGTVPEPGTIALLAAALVAVGRPRKAAALKGR
jgi:PEP-CTERM motif